LRSRVPPWCSRNDKQQEGIAALAEAQRHRTASGGYGKIKIQGQKLGEALAGGLTLAVTFTFTYAAPLVARLTGCAGAGAAIEAVGARAASIIGLRIVKVQEQKLNDALVSMGIQ
jgi:hypothetical protein